MRMSLGGAAVGSEKPRPPTGGAESAAAAKHAPPSRSAIGVGAFQLPRVIEGGVRVNDSREFDLHSGWHWQLGGGGLHLG